MTRKSKREQKQFKTSKQYDGFFVPGPEEATNKLTAPVDVVMPQTLNEPSGANPVPPAAPLDSTAMQQKAAAALARKMADLNSTNAPR